MPDKTAETVAHLIIEEMYPRFGCALELVTDNGSENVNRVVKETLDTLNIHHITTSYYHPGSNSKVERFHRTLHDILAKRLQDGQDVWDLHLNQVLAAVRFNVSEATGYTPYYLLYGRDAVLPLDNLLKPRLKYQGEDMHQMALQSSIRHLCWCTAVLRSSNVNRQSMDLVGWLVGCFGLNGPLRQYFSLPERGRKKREVTDERKNVHTTPTRTYCKRNRPLPYLNPKK